MARGKPLIDSEQCKGCELCIAACPEKILKMSETFNKQGNPYAICKEVLKCTACTQCAIICPDLAIKIFKEQTK